MDEMTEFYRDVLGLKLVAEEPGFRDFDAGACRIALHAGVSRVGTKAPKMAFFARDVATARAKLVKRGAKMGPVKTWGKVALCEGKDPDGNPVQLSNRA